MSYLLKVITFYQKKKLKAPIIGVYCMSKSNEIIMSKNFTLLSFFDIFIEILLRLENIRDNNYLLSWVEKLQSWGKYVFSLEQIKADFPDVSDQALSTFNPSFK